MRISDWSSDLCSSDLQAAVGGQRRGAVRAEAEDVGKQRAQGGIDGGGGRISHEHILQPRPSAERANALNAGPHAAMRDGLKASICHSGSCQFIQSALSASLPVPKSPLAKRSTVPTWRNRGAETRRPGNGEGTG